MTPAQPNLKQIEVDTAVFIQKTAHDCSVPVWTSSQFEIAGIAASDVLMIPTLREAPIGAQAAGILLSGEADGDYAPQPSTSPSRVIVSVARRALYTHGHPSRIDHQGPSRLP